MLKALRFALAHRYALVGIVSRLICLWFLLSGCASNRATGGENTVKVDQAVEPEWEATYEQVGGIPPDWGKIVPALRGAEKGREPK